MAISLLRRVELSGVWRENELYSASGNWEKSPSLITPGQEKGLCVCGQWLLSDKGSFYWASQETVEID